MEATLDLGVVGAGRWGEKLLRAFSRTNRCSVRVLCEADGERLERVRARYQVPHSSTEVLDVFDNAAVAAVALATPATTHAPLVVAALSKGKHVFVEKPMALSVADAVEIRVAAERFGRRVMVGHILEYHPAVVQLRTMVAAGTLGTIRYVIAERLGLATGPRDTSAWWSLAPHDISVVRFVLGAEPVAVRATGQTLEGGFGEDVVSADVRFADGAVAFVHVSALDPIKTRRLTFVGTRSTATFDDVEPTAKLRVHDTPPEVLRFPSARASAPVPPSVAMPIADDEPLAVESLHFVDAILDGTPIRSDIDDGLDVTRVLEAGARSIGQGGALERVHRDGCG